MTNKFSIQRFQKKLDEAFPSQYELLKFEGMIKKALLKHANCGYIFAIREFGDSFDCQENAIELLEIKYTELKNINSILSSRFNDQG